MIKIILLVFSAVICSFAKENREDFQVLIVSADDSYVASEKNLEFASMDANRLAKALTSAAKVSEQNIVNLKNPSIEEFDVAVSSIAKRATQKFMFYFSGHSDENGLHLKDGSVTKSKFHDLLAKVSSKVKIVILDSCFSGSLKSKGVVKSKPIELVQYDVDEPTGSVILTSSSGTELSYESARLKGSIFTYHLVSGLYGQADSNSDGLVTIDELYQYVYSQTKFQSMVSGGKVQSPEFESKLTGQGALVVSYPARINGHVLLASATQGELALTSGKGINFFRFYKNRGEEKVVSLPRGQYDITWTEEGRIGTGQIDVTEKQTVSLDTDGLVWQKRDVPSVRAKGAQPKFLFGLNMAFHPPFHQNEQGSAMGEFFLLSPSTEALRGRWRLAVHLGGETHKIKDSTDKADYNRMTIGGEGNYPGLGRLNNEWLIGLRFGQLTGNNNFASMSNAPLTHFFIGSRFYPDQTNINLDILLGSDSIKLSDGQSKSVGTFGMAISF